MSGRSPLRGSGSRPTGGAAISVASPAKPSVPNAEWDETNTFIVKVPVGRGWRKWGRGRFYNSADEAIAAGETAAKSHGRARVIQQNIMIRETIIHTVDERPAKEALVQATLSNVKTGSTIIADDGFTCLANGSRLTVEDDGRGLFVPCGDGRHYLDGQLDDGTDYIGFSVSE